MPLLKGVVVVVVIATAYCSCPLCTYPYSDGITASGTYVMEGRTIAAGPSLPFNTQVYIEGVGWRVVEDRGGAIGDNQIDIYFDCHQAALRFGRRTLTVLWKEYDEDDVQCVREDTKTSNTNPVQ